MPEGGPDLSQRRRLLVLSILTLVMAGVLAQDVAAQDENPLEILAVRVREQGHACDTPLKAEREESASEAHRAVWRLQCSNASYRIVLHPDMGAEIELVR